MLIVVLFDNISIFIYRYFTTFVRALEIGLLQKKREKTASEWR